MSGPQLWVIGVDATGTELVRLVLPHGMGPELLLAQHGFRSFGAKTIGGQADPHALELQYVVGQADGIHVPNREPLRDPGLVLRPGETAWRRQRVAVYALCHSSRGVLLTQFSDRTNAPQLWGLPGGGIDPGELAEAALHREVHEETGQQLRVERLLGVHDAHWVGRAPSGRLEDFHAVRLVYLATCPQPSDAVVHDVGGTTLSAAWVPLDQVGDVPFTKVWRRILVPWLPAVRG